MGYAVLIAGAGRSSSSVISWWQSQIKSSGGSLTVGDVSYPSPLTYPWGRTIPFDITNTEASRKAIREVDVVISLIPAHLHPRLATLCLEERKHLLTASYVSDEMRSFDHSAADRGLLFLNECGLDPGIDHMSALQVIDRVRQNSGVFTSFESFTGGLIAPETDPENPWRYKFTWNPRNVVMAGQGTAKFLAAGTLRYIPYAQLFRRTIPISIAGEGDFEGYANRDSLNYITTYGLESIRTMLRGTLRCSGFCSAWDVLVQSGCTDDSYPLAGVERMTHAGFLESFLAAGSGTVEDRLAHQSGLRKSSPEFQKLRWSGFFDPEPVGLAQGTPAQVLEHILNKKWKLNPADKDLVVMWHRFRYQLRGEEKELQASLVVKGVNSIETAMANTVGLPLAIASKLLLDGKIGARGVRIPVTKEFYDPILAGLRTAGISLEERLVENI